MSAKASDVEVFLQTFRKAATQFGITIWTTPENSKYLNDSGHTKQDVEDIIHQLAARNYHKGPEPDDNPSRPPGDVWVFEREHEGFELYIKLKLLNNSSLPEPVVCMSFHEEKRPMKTPLRPVRGRS